MPTDEKKKRILQKQDCSGYYMGFSTVKTRPFFGSYQVPIGPSETFLIAYIAKARLFREGWNENTP